MKDKITITDGDVQDIEHIEVLLTEAIEKAREALQDVQTTLAHLRELQEED